MKFYRCNHCGNIIIKIEDSKVPVVCCGEPMQELVANTSDGASEKHVPIVNVSGNTVEVNIGSVNHPMLPEHHIAWIYVETRNGGQFRYLPAAGEPHASFFVNDEVVAVYEYCNLHGLWKTVVNN